MNLQGRSLLKETDLTAAEFLHLVDLGGQLRLEKHVGQRCSRLAGRNIAFPAGSMGPKIEAACRFVEATGQLAAIGRLCDAQALLAGETGTIITG